MPIPLRAPETGVHFGRMEEHITLKINGGPRPDTGRAVLVLGFGHGIPAGACDNLGVRLNTHPVSACEEPEYDSISTAHRDCPRHGWECDFIEIARFFDLPLSTCCLTGTMSSSSSPSSRWPPGVGGGTGPACRQVQTGGVLAELRFGLQKSQTSGLLRVGRPTSATASSRCQPLPADVKTHVAVVSEVLEGPQESLRRRQRNSWSRAIAVRMHCPARKRLNKLIT